LGEVFAAATLLPVAEAFLPVAETLGFYFGIQISSLQCADDRFEVKCLILAA
jgi:hypothetical protein